MVNIMTSLESTANKIVQLMDNPDNIRNISIVGDFGTGKSTLCDSLVCNSGVMTDPLSADVKFAQRMSHMGLQHHIDFPSIIPLIHSMHADTDSDCASYLLNLSDSSTAPLNINDGVVLTVACDEMVCTMEMEVLVHNLISQRIRPVLVVNKIDRCVGSSYTAEATCVEFSRVIDEANTLIQTHEDSLLGDVTVCPHKGTVAFCSGLEGWGFTLHTFAKMYASKFGVEVSKMMQLLWVDHFFDKKTWKDKDTDVSTCTNGFVQFCIQPIRQLMKACILDDKEALWPMLTELGIKMNAQDKKLHGKWLMKRVLQRWLPLADVLLETIVVHLPSPSFAQRYRVDHLYQGPLDDKYADAIRNCDPEGPLMMLVSNFVPSGSDSGRHFALGRVFSGRLSKNLVVRVMGPNYVTAAASKTFGVEQPIVWMGKANHPVETVPCGTTIALLSVKELDMQDSTLTNETELDAYQIGSVLCEDVEEIKTKLRRQIREELEKESFP
ncbi:elongation factor 2 [Tanacetum coccineum]